MMHFFLTMQEKTRGEKLIIQHTQRIRGHPLQKVGMFTSAPSITYQPNPSADKQSQSCCILYLPWSSSHLLIRMAIVP